MDSITLNYTPLGGSLAHSVLTILVEKGLTKAEFYSMYPQIKNEYVDGSSDTQYKAFIRKCHFRTSNLTSAQLTAYLGWCLDNARTIDYTVDGITETGIAITAEAEQSTSWYDDFKATPYLEGDLTEGIARDWAHLPPYW